MSHSFLHDLVVLLVVVNPIGKVPLFLSVAGNLLPAEQRRIACRATLIAGIVLTGFLLFGQPALGALGVSMQSMQIAGGLVLLLIGLKMVLEDVHTPTQERVVLSEDIAVFPLAMPFIAGPGAIMAVLDLTDDDLFTLSDQAETFVAMTIALAASLGCMLTAKFMSRILGRTGANAISRIMGLILASLAANSIIKGIRVALLT